MLIKQQWDALGELADSPNTVIVIMPYEALQSGAADAALMRELVGDKVAPPAAVSKSGE